MKPHVTCLMLSSIDGRLHPSRYTDSPDGSRKDWSAAYERVHGALGADAWLVGRVTMAEMTEGAAPKPGATAPVDRPIHVAAKADSHAVAVDPSGKLRFASGSLDGDHVIVLLGPDVADGHLAELAANGVSYVVCDDADIDFAAALGTLGGRFGIRTLLLEGGGGINGALFAAGVVDALSVLVVPALDGGTHRQGIVMHGEDGLAGKVRLGFESVETLDSGIVHLRYRVHPV